MYQYGLSYISTQLNDYTEEIVYAKGSDIITPITDGMISYNSIGAIKSKVNYIKRKEKWWLYVLVYAIQLL